MTDLTTVLADNAVEPYRIRQRICAFYLAKAKGDGEFTSKELRVLCKEHETFNSPNFSRNLKQDSEFFEGSTKEGWSLTEQGKIAANGFFDGAPIPAGLPTEITPDEVEAEEVEEEEVEEEEVEPVVITKDDLENVFPKVAVPAVHGGPVPSVPAPTPVGIVNIFPPFALANPMNPMSPATTPATETSTPKPPVKKVAAVVIAKRPPEMRGSQMLAALFHKIND